MTARKNGDEMSEFRTCGDCFYYQPNRNPETGRVRPAFRGECGWTWPKVYVWPAAFTDTYGQAWDPTPRARWRPFADTDAQRCKTFAPKPERVEEKVKPKQETLL